MISFDSVNNNKDYENIILNKLNKKFNEFTKISSLKTQDDIMRYICETMLNDVEHWKVSSFFFFLSNQQQIYAELLDVIVFQINDSVSTNFKVKVTGLKN